MSEKPATPRPSATLMLLRGGGKHSSAALEVLMMRRSPEARVMPNVWVFPGGSVDPEDIDRADHGEHAHRIAAVRELAEESAIELESEHEVRPWSRWITPEVVPVRFDTRFYIARAPAHAKPTPDMTEVHDARWFAPRAALDEYAAGTIELIFPTIMHLLMLDRHLTVDAAFEAAPAEPPDPVQPEIVGEGEAARILLDGVEYELPRTAALETSARFKR